MQEYIEYVEEQINYFKKHSKLHQGQEVTPTMVNTTLSHYTNVGVALIGEYTRHKYELYELNKEYERWHNQKFHDVRKKLTDEFEGKTIKIALKEIETEVKVAHETEYWDWRDKINDLELRLKFLQGLIDQWQKLDSVLNNLSRNMRQEMISLSIENRMNKADNSETKLRTKFPELRKRIPVD